MGSAPERDDENGVPSSEKRKATQKWVCTYHDFGLFILRVAHVLHHISITVYPRANKQMISQVDDDDNGVLSEGVKATEKERENLYFFFFFYP